MNFQILFSWENKKNISKCRLLNFLLCMLGVDEYVRSKCASSTAHFREYTDNPLYTDTRYNDKIHYNDNLTVTKPLLKR